MWAGRGQGLFVQIDRVGQHFFVWQGRDQLREVLGGQHQHIPLSWVSVSRLGIRLPW